MKISELKTLVDIDLEVEDYTGKAAVPCVGDLHFVLRFPKSKMINAAKIILHSDGYDGGERYIEKEMYLDDRNAFFDLGTKELQSLSSKGLFYYHYVIVNKDYSEEIYGGDDPVFLEKDGCDRQLLCYDPCFETPDFLKGGAIYHIFVDRFRKSDKCKVRPDGRLNPDFENGKVEYPPYRGAEFKNNEFFGGDLYGVADKLDYIKSMGFSIIYLSPIFSSPSNHKYDTEDYMKVDEGFGGDEALENLIGECKKRNMHLILDGVFNHTGADSVYFDVNGRFGNGAMHNADSPYSDWYYFTEDRKSYASWWGIKILPKVNCDNASYRNFILGKNGVVKKYMKMGVDGFRIDVADELSDGFLNELRKSIKEENPNGIVIGEVWEDASNKIAYSKRRYYLSGHQLDSVMNYPLRNGIISFIKNGNVEELVTVLEGIYNHYPEPVTKCLMNFLGTHDTERILTVLGTDYEPTTNDDASSAVLSSDERAEGLKKLRCAYAICALVYGVPSVFYGDEAGLEGYHDPFCRAPYPWGREDGETVKFFSEINALRGKYKPFGEGKFRVLDFGCDFIEFVRYFDGEFCTVVITRNSPHTFCSSEKAVCIFGKHIGKEDTSFMVDKWSVGVFFGCGLQNTDNSKTFNR